MKLKELIIIGLALLGLASQSLAYPSQASEEERRELDELASEIEGAMIYTHRGKVKKITIGSWKTQELGSGDYARWGPLGQRIAVQDDDSIYIMNADGSDRKQILKDEVNGGDGCQIEFHPNAREIIYGTRRRGAHIIDIASRKSRDLQLPFNTEFNISADGKHLVMRRGDCYLVELPGTKSRKYAGGCSPCVSPDGSRMTSNRGGHRTMDIQKWNGTRLFQINAKKMGPDHKWDNMHWSNHNDYIGMQGDGRRRDSYAFCISKNAGVRLSWEGGTKYPDLFVSKDRKSGEIPMHRTVAWKNAQPGQPQVVKAEVVNKEAAPKKKSDGTENEIRALTGSPTRIVWCQARGGDHYGDNTYLMGICTEDGKGEHRILSAGGNYSKPFLTPDGEQIVYTDRKENKFYIVNWDGSNGRELGSGYASDVWRDPSNGIFWVYYRGGNGKTKGGVMRQRLDDPKVKEKVWDKTPTGHEVVPWFRLSADGTHVATAFPWSSCGVADLTKGNWEKYGGGCWASMAPDNSYRYFHFNGSHRDISVYEAGKKDYRKVSVAGGPGVGNSKVYFPRWGNDVRLLTVGGPKFSDKQEILLGRFDSKFTKVEKWVKVSHNDKMDLYGDVWTKRGWEVKLGEKAKATLAKQPEKKEEREPTRDLSKFKTWPGDQRDLVFLWENNSATNQLAGHGESPGRLCQILARDRAVFGRHYEMILTDGQVVAEEIDEPLMKACRASDSLSVETTITAFSNSSGKIVSASNGDDSNFALIQSGDKLEFHIRTSKGQQKTELCTLNPGTPHHVLVSYHSGKLAAYLDGEKVHETDRISGDLDDWKTLPVAFGGSGWDGSMEGVSIYSRPIFADEASHKSRLFAERMGDRKPIDSLQVEAKLVEMTATPAVEALQEYSRGLVVYAYEVAKVVQGSQNAPKIQVAHWAILDRKLLPEMGSRKLGETYQLRLEALDAHPQLQSERSFNDCEDFDIPIYYATKDRGNSNAKVLVAKKASEIHIKVNCGGPSIDDWQSDGDFVDRKNQGSSFTFKKKADVSSVSNPAPSKVYNTVRHREHRYGFDLPNGEYLVRLHFTDDHDDDGKIRKMDFVIEDQQALTRFNIVKAAGGSGKAVVREFPVKVSDGDGLQIRGEDHTGGDVFAAAIEIVSR